MKVNKTDTCWLWTAGKNSTGYGTFNPVNYAPPVNAHRFSYEMAKGKIPDGGTVDHLCRNRLCVRPDHLEIVSLTVNIHRAEGWGGQNFRKTHCPKGHPYEGENVYVDRAGSRHCRACRAERMKRWHATH